VWQWGSRCYNSSVTDWLKIEEGQKQGFWAWDCKTRQPVLLIPSVLALLGDNPMQSELSCHIGMHGKLFCRCCFVRGQDSAKKEPKKTKKGAETSPFSISGQASPILVSDGEGSETTRSGNSSIGSDSERSSSHSAGDVSAEEKKKGKRKLETPTEMLERVRRFLMYWS
jgi:hypothetical protein